MKTRILFIGIIFSILSSLRVNAQIEANMQICGDICNNSYIYLTIAPEDLLEGQNSTIIRITTTFSDTKISVRIQENKDIDVTAEVNLNNGTPNGIEGNAFIRIRPAYKRNNETKPLRLYVDSETICILFETDCQTQCSKLPNIINELSGIFQNFSNITINTR